VPCPSLGSSSSSSNGGRCGGLVAFSGGGGGGGREGRRVEGGREGLSILVTHVIEHPHAEFGELGGEEELEEREGRGKEEGDEMSGGGKGVRTSLPIQTLS